MQALPATKRGKRQHFFKWNILWTGLSLRTYICTTSLSFHAHSYAVLLMSRIYIIGFLRFGPLLPYESPQELDLLSEEFTEYQLLQDTDVPQNVRDKATVIVEKGQAYHRIDVLWHYLSSLRAADNSYRFPRITGVAKLVLTIPHSNAQEERLFSMVRKNKTAFRPSLDPKGTLSSILAAAKEPTHSFKPTIEVLSKAKAATWEYNKAHSRK